MRSTFREDHQGRPVLDMRSAAARRAVTLDDLPTLTERDRAMAIRTWRKRMVNEHISAQVWSALLSQGMRAALPAKVLTGIADAASDELRHGEQCAAVLVALGGKPIAHLPPIETVPSHDDVAPLEAFLRNLISVGCMSETVAVSVIRAEQAELDDSKLGRILSTILADEIQHARLGWEVLGMVTPLLRADARARLEDYLVDAFAHQVAHELAHLPLLNGATAEAARAGVCDGGFARTVFFDTITDIIVPGLEQAGLDASTAWAKAQALNPAQRAS